MEMSKELISKRDHLALNSCRHRDKRVFEYKRYVKGFDDCHEEMQTELETERMKVVACGVAAMLNTPKSIDEQGIDNSSPYWSASYGDVCDAVDREIKLRDENARLVEALKRIEKSPFTGEANIARKALAEVKKWANRYHQD